MRTGRHWRIRRSTNHGIAWQEIEGYSTCSAIVISPDQDVYSWFQGLGVYCSSDNGASWQSTNLPGLGAILFIDSTQIMVADWDSLYISQDKGDTWTFLKKWHVAALTKDKQDRIFVGGDNGIIRSSDNGLTWTQITNLGVNDLDINSEGDLLVVTREAPRLYSSNNGENWKNINPGEVTANYIDFNKEGDLFLSTHDGLFRSKDNGVSWDAVGVPASAVDDIAIDAEGRIYANSGGLNLSEDNGNKWTRIIQEGVDFAHIAVNSKGDVIVGGDGIYRSTDHGNNWITISDMEINALEIDSEDNIYVVSGDDGILSSSDNGASWNSRGLENADLENITTNSENHVFAVGRGIYMSVDKGETWEAIGLESYSRLNSVVVDLNGYIYVGSEWGEFFSSKDDGKNWKKTTFDDHTIYCIISDANGYLFAGLSDGVYCSTDYGENWMPANDGLKQWGNLCIQIMALAVNPDNIIFGAYLNWGIHRGEIYELSE